jgi:hypothetical protein
MAFVAQAPASIQWNVNTIGRTKRHGHGKKAPQQLTTQPFGMSLADLDGPLIGNCISATSAQNGGGRSISSRKL